MSKNQSTDGSGGEFYDLKEIPFEPTGAAADKYPYVAPKKFSILEEKMDEVVKERKLYVILFRAPQGGGKTATTVELRHRIDGRSYAGGKVVAILNKLIDLEFSHYAGDFMTEVTPLLPDFKWEKYKGKNSPGELKNAVASVLKKLAADNKLVVWIIDEFDILVDYPKEKQSQFLQILREIIDELSNERLPILFIMSHTIKSSKEFERHLKEIHGPLQSRLVATLDIGYSYSEVRAVVTERLRSVRKKELAFNAIEPFTEDALKELYTLIMATGGTGELNDFRLFERCCYFAILNNAQKKRKSIEKDDIRQVFQEQFKSWAKPEPGEKLSLAVRAERASIFSATQMMRNEAVLKGLVIGLKLMKDQFSELVDVRTRYAGKISDNIHIGALECSVHHKPTGKKVSLIWILAAKEDGIMLQDDLRTIGLAITKTLQESSNYTNLSILSYVSDFDLDASTITNCERVLRISSDTVRDLIGLSIGSVTNEDVDLLRKNFDSDVAPLVRQIFDESTRDITKEMTDSVRRLVVALNISHSTNMKLTREALRDEEKKLFGSASRVADRQLSDLFALGFAKETGTQIVPSEPKALIHLTELFRKDGSIKEDHFMKEFSPNGESVLNVAKVLGLVTIDDDGTIRRRQDQKKEVGRLVEVAKPLLSKEAQETFDGGKAAHIIKAAEAATSDSLSGAIVLSAAQELLPPIEERLGKLIKHPVAEETPQESQGTLTTPKHPSSSVAQAAKQVAGLEKAVLSILETKQPMTLEELKRELIAQGFPADVTSKIVGMILQNRLKLAT